MKPVEIKELYDNTEKYIDKEVETCGWVRSIRDSKTFGFITVNDGTFFKPIQVVYSDKLNNFSEISKTNIGAALIIKGKLVATPNAKQPFEIQAEEVIIEGESTGDYPLQKKRHSFEYLRTISHLRPRTNTFQAVFRVRSLCAYAIHKFFQEQGFVYDIIRENFLIGNGSSMSEEERQANISLGMKKAEYAANNFISEDKKSSFLDAMESIAKLASAGKMNADGNMDYGVKKGNYLGHGSNLVYTTDGLDMMRSMDSGAYDEYQRISRESSNSDRQLNTLKYLTNWYSNAVTKNPHMVEKYEAKSDEYIEKNVKNQKRACLNC